MARDLAGGLGDPNERRTWIPIYSISLLFMSTIFVSIRIVSRLVKTTGEFGLDDVILIFAWLFGGAFTIMFTIGAMYFGYDRHSSAFTIEMVQKAGLLGWLGEILYMLGSNCTKIVVLLFYRRLVSSGIRRALLWTIYIFIAFTVVFMFTFTFLVAFECNPVEARWLQFDSTWIADHQFRCMDRTVIVPLNGALSVFGDVYSIVIPLIIVSGLPITKKQKLELYLVFGFGITVIAAGVARTIYVNLAEHELDVAWYGANAIIASNAEIHLAMVCACAPAARALFRSHVERKLAISAPFSGGRVKQPGENYTKKPSQVHLKTDSASTWTSRKTWSTLGLSKSALSSATCITRSSEDTDRQVILQDLKPARTAPSTPRSLYTDFQQHRDSLDPSIAKRTASIKTQRSQRSKYDAHKSFGETHEYGITQSREISVAYEPLVPEVPPLPPSRMTYSSGGWHTDLEDPWSGFGFSTVKF